MTKLRIIGMILFVLLGILYGTEGAQAAVTRPMFIGHRGVGDPAVQRLGIPENSIPAWQFADQVGADVLDMDVQITADQKMVIMHDTTLNRTTNRTGKVADRSLDYIKASWLELPGVDLNDNGNDDDTNEHPPSLREALGYVKASGRLLSVELKGNGWTSAQVGRYLTELRYHGVQARTISHSFSPTVVGHLKAQAPTYPRGSVVSGSPLPSAATAKARGGYLYISLGLADKTYVANMQTSGVKVIVYTVDTSAGYQAAKDLGAWGWDCDEVDEAIGWWESHA